MKEITYRDFSLNTHENNLSFSRPSVCQFELTFQCGLRCSHCYTGCYNRAPFIKKELNTKGVKSAIDKICGLGAMWLCFTGGDPMARRDFIEIYKYAKQKGFLISVFTSGYFLSDECLRVFKESPPFVIEITLNAATKKCFEKISHVKGSFERVMKNIRRIRKEKLPLAIKTLVTRENLSELPRIKKFVRQNHMNFSPSAILYARLNGDTGPCDLRISPEELLRLDGVLMPGQDACLKNKKKAGSQEQDFFPCAAQGGDGFFVDPYGSMFFCPLMRRPARSIISAEAGESYVKLLSDTRRLKFISDSVCRTCGRLSKNCMWCPGKAYVEMGNREEPIEYFCRLSSLEAQHA